MKNKKRLMYASVIGVASVLACVVQAVPDTVVPPLWNTPTWTEGSKLEQFSTLPLWASNEALITGTARPDTRFWAPTSPEKVLSFATLGITNTFGDAKIQIGMPVFIDMRCKLNPFDTTPPAMDPNTILCFYANQNSNLVVASASQCITNDVIPKIDPGQYYPIMIRFASDKFDVFFNSDTVVAASLNATTNEISKMVVSGAGEMDDFYISYGDPRRENANSGVTLGWVPDTAEERVVANWLANKTTSGTFTQANAEKFYLTDTTPITDTFNGELGIGSFSYDPSNSNVTVVVTLKTDASTKKSGKINGLLALKGAGDYSTAKANGWVDIGTKTILTNDFLNGVANYKFELTGNANTNKFFLPVIKSQITQ